MGNAISAIKIADDYIFGFRQNHYNLIEAYQHRDPATAVESCIEQGTSVSNLSYYLTNGTRFLSNFGYLVEQQADKAPTWFSSIFSNPIFLKFIGGFGEAASVFALIKESVALDRQNQFHTIFERHVWRGDELDAALTEIKDYKPSALKRVVPEWMHNELEERGGKNYLAALIKKVQAKDSLAVEEGTILVEKMRAYSNKKKILQVIGMVAAIIGVIGFIAMLAACPAAAVTVLIWASFALTIAAYIYKKGVVENPDGGFSFLRCFPEFIQKKFHKEPPMNPIGLQYIRV